MTTTRNYPYLNRVLAAQDEKNRRLDEKRAAILAHLRAGLTQAQISEIHGVSPAVLFLALVRWGISGRAAQKARTQARHLALVAQVQELRTKKKITLAQVAKELRCSQTLLYRSLKFVKLLKKQAT